MKDQLSMLENNQSASASCPPSQAERCFTVLFLVLLTGAFVNLFISPEQILEPGEGMPGARLVWAAVYVGALIFWLRHCKGYLKVFLNERAILMLVSLAIVSAVWSDSPTTTLRRSIALVGTCLIALYFAARFKIREQLQLLGWAFGTCTVFSLAFGWFHLGHSVDGMEGAWYGIYTQRNELGSMMLLSVLLFMLLSQIRPKARWISWIFATISFVLIVLSGSVTSLIAFFVLLFSAPIISMLRSSKRAGTVIFISAIVVVGLGWWVGASFEDTAEAMGRDSSLTGRTELWAASALIGLERPWLGYGYNAFWLGSEGQSVDVWRIVGWAAPSAHNGLLEIWLDLGATGVAIAVFSFAASLRKSLRLIRTTKGWEYAWPLLFLVFLFVLNLTQSVFFEGNSIYWFLYMVMALNLSLLRPVEMRIKAEAIST
jgi:exopolysaccharide production protein ExoQ